MVEVTVYSVRVSLTNQQRLIILKEVDAERYLPIWIGPFEAEAITIELQGYRVPRPLTHDLLKNCLARLGAKVRYVVVNDLRNETFYARIMLDVDGRELDIDSRPSDAIALAVRVGAPIYVSESVMERAAIVPEEEEATDEDDRLSAFRDFVNSLDLDDLGPEDSEL